MVEQRAVTRNFVFKKAAFSRKVDRKQGELSGSPNLFYILFNEIDG